MVNKSKKIFAIIASIIVLLIILGIVLSVLYVKTDFLKSSKVLFSKYMQQNITIFNELQSTTISDAYKNIKSNDKYESNTNFKVEYSEGGEVSNPINDLSMKINTQKDAEDKYVYTDAQVLLKDEEYLQIELIKEEEIYGMRFSDVVKQFLTIKDDEDLQEVVDDLGLDIKVANDFMNMLDGKEIVKEKISGEKIRELQTKYLNLLMQNMDKVSTYSKLKNSMITVNNQTIKANAYTITLSKDQVKNIIIEILNNIKTDNVINALIKEIDVYSMQEQNQFAKQIEDIISQIEESQEIGDLKVTVYERKGITVRTSIEMGVNNIIIESSSENGKTEVKIQSNVLNSEKVNQKNIEIVKTNTENQETFNIILDILDGDEKQTLNVSNDLQLNVDTTNIMTRFSYNKDILTVSLIIDNEIKANDSIQKNMKTDETNNIVLNELNKESRINIINIVKERTSQKFIERIELLKKELGLSPESQTEEDAGENTLSEVDVNRFNAKFEFYTGDAVTAENVKTLLEVVKSNIKSVEFPTIVSEESGLSQSNTETIKLNIEKDTENIELIDTVMEKIKDNRKYKVQITYNNTDGLIDYITISEVK